MYQVLNKELNLIVGDCYCMRKIDGKIGRFKKLYLSTKFFPVGSKERLLLIKAAKTATEKNLDTFEFKTAEFTYMLRK